MKKYDVIIVGGSMVGLSLAALLQKNNFSVAVVESKKIEFSHHASIGRVSAIHNTSQHLFEYLDAWKKLLVNAAPLCEMKIWDHTQNANLHFDSSEINYDQMGWIIENHAIVESLFEKLSDVDFYAPNFPEKFSQENNKIIVTLNNNEKIEASLIVGADGANSCVREHMKIDMQIRSYHQKAIIAVIESQHPHNNIAHQKFLTTGPVALLPSPNQHHTSLVWSADEMMSDELMNKSDDDFSQSLTEALDFKLGKLKVISPRSQFNLTMRHAEEYAIENFALAGDAAHTIHPLAGLGVNLGLMDAACLAEVLVDARNQKKNIGDIRVLRRYTRWRKAENTQIIQTMRALKEIFALDTTTSNLIRSFGINTIDQCALIKNKFMFIAMGQSNDLPAFLQQ